jgi:hypothetical protein
MTYLETEKQPSGLDGTGTLTAARSPPEGMLQTLHQDRASEFRCDPRRAEHCDRPLTRHTVTAALLENDV